MKSFFIPGNVPSSKNSRRIVTIKRKDGTKQQLSIASDQTKRYQANVAYIFRAKKSLFRKTIAAIGPAPYYIGFFFIRKSKHRFDQINPAQTVQDEMVDHEWIDDDDVTNFCPCPVFIENSFWKHHAKDPGVLIVVYETLEEMSKVYTPLEIFQSLVDKNDINYYRNAFNAKRKAP